DKPGDDKPGEGDGSGDVPAPGGDSGIPDIPAPGGGPSGGGGGPSGGGGGPSGGGGGPSGGGGGPSGTGSNGDQGKGDQGKGDQGKGDQGKGDGANNGGYTEDKYASAKAIKNVAHIVINEVAPELRNAFSKVTGNRSDLLIFGVAGIPLSVGHDRARSAASDYLTGGVSLVNRWDTALQKSSLTWKDADDSSKYEKG
ncbi:hypothetical protein, partial [Nonomuraea dietziae]|uniref:hypothetical protein n=1 Tax=Nonomuraea dietziae TaxID=65515 RepID=UPI003447A2DE